MWLVKTLATQALMNMSLLAVVGKQSKNTCVVLHVHPVPIVE